MKTVEPARIPGSELQQLVKALAVHGAYIAGSFAAFMASRKAPMPHDVDIWLPTQDAFNYHHVRQLIETSGRVLPGTELTDWAAGYRIDTEASLEEFLPATHFQVINPMNADPGRLTWGEPEALIEEFDFTCVQAAILPDWTILVGDTTIEDIEIGELIVNRTTTPLYSLERAFKKGRSGFTLPRSELLSLVNAYKNHPDNRPSGYQPPTEG